MQDKKQSHIINRRTFLKVFGAGTAALTTATIAGCDGSETTPGEPPVGKMTYRINPNTGEKVSILGFGMMRLPSKGARASARENGDGEIDQEMVNRQVDYALEHGVNLFDTSPMYCKGGSEHATGIALSRHPRHTYQISTKMSNMHDYSREASIEMFNNSLKELQTDYLDYYLLHNIGGSDDRDDPMALFEDRFINNGILDFMLDGEKVYVMEINTIPGSLSFYLWEPMGVSYAKLIDKMVELALRAHAEKNRAVFAFDSDLLNQCALGQKGGKLHA